MKSAGFHDSKVIYFLPNAQIKNPWKLGACSTMFLPNVKITGTKDVSSTSSSFFILLTESLVLAHVADGWSFNASFWTFRWHCWNLQRILSDYMSHVISVNYDTLLNWLIDHRGVARSFPWGALSDFLREMFTSSTDEVALLVDWLGRTSELYWNRT